MQDFLYREEETLNSWEIYIYIQTVSLVSLNNRIGVLERREFLFDHAEWIRRTKYTGVRCTLKRSITRKAGQNRRFMLNRRSDGGVAVALSRTKVTLNAGQ